VTGQLQASPVQVSSNVPLTVAVPASLLMSNLNVPPNLELPKVVMSKVPAVATDHTFESLRLTSAPTWPAISLPPAARMVYWPGATGIIASVVPAVVVKLIELAADWQFRMNPPSPLDSPMMDREDGDSHWLTISVPASCGDVQEDVTAPLIVTLHEPLPAAGIAKVDPAALGWTGELASPAFVAPEGPFVDAGFAAAEEPQAETTRATTRMLVDGRTRFIGTPFASNAPQTAMGEGCC
jgi:hypothetical protein